MRTDPITPRQEELLEHALALVRDAGLSGLTVRKLAERVGFTEAALYRHYPSKQALLLALVERLSQERLLAPIRELAADRSRPPLERLEAIVRHHVRTVLEVDGFPILVLAEAAATGDEPLLERFRGILAEVMAMLGGVFSELPPDAARPSPRGVLLVFFGLAAATALHHRLLPDPELERQAWQELPTLLVHSLLAGAPRAVTGPGGTS
jgi:AcrR family transcriptional regulator